MCPHMICLLVYRVNSDHNRTVTETIIVQPILAGKGTNVYLIQYVRIYVSFNQQLYERQMKHAVRHEVAVMQKLNKKYMFDEETDGEDQSTLIRRSPD